MSRLFAVDVATPCAARREATATMRLRSGLPLAVLLTLHSLGCTSSSTNPDGGAGQVVCLPLDAGLPVVVAWLGVDAGPDGEPLERFMDDYYAAFCDGMSRCRPFESYLIANCVEQLRSSGMFSAPTECEEIGLGLECAEAGNDVSNVATHINAVGKGLTYDPHSAATCLAVPWAACATAEQHFVYPPSCENVFGATIPDGGACQFDIECIGGTCTPDGAVCGGTCSSSASQTLVIGPGTVCAYGAGCGTENGLTCDGVNCRGEATAGASCSAVGYYGCAAGFYCDGFGTCQPLIAQGGACLLDARTPTRFSGPDLMGLCQIGLVCQGEALLTDGGQRPGTCQPPSRIGGACAQLAKDEVQHVTGCIEGAVCSCGVCVPAPTSGACADGPVPCMPYVAACDYTDAGTCHLVSSFRTCLSGQQCSTGYCSAGSTCTFPPAVGCPF